MISGGIRAEWLVGCEDCGIDVEPGRFYDSEWEARHIRDRAVKHESWLLDAAGHLKCPECAAGSPPSFPGAARVPGTSPRSRTAPPAP